MCYAPYKFPHNCNTSRQKIFFPGMKFTIVPGFFYKTGLLTKSLQISIKGHFSRLWLRSFHYFHHGIPESITVKQISLNAIVSDGSCCNTSPPAQWVLLPSMLWNNQASSKVIRYSRRKIQLNILNFDWAGDKWLTPYTDVEATFEKELKNQP
jgi:hypothetical protein